MLQSLYIKNIALISEMNVDFSGGLNIITGETGAGKSIIIDSINLALGERAGKELIKNGETKAKVEASFYIGNNSKVISMLEDESIEADETIIISRELAEKGDGQTIKSVCRINGTMVSIATLKAVTEQIIDIHGQHEHQSLLSQPKHMGFLDAFAGEGILRLKERVRKLYKEYHEVKKSMLGSFMSEQDREQRIDILSYQINEIEETSPERDEEQALEAERNILANAERIMQALRCAGELLCSGENGALSLAQSACKELYPIADISDEYKAMSENLSEAYYTLEGAAYAVKDAAESFEFDEQRLDEVESRLSKLSALKRKYGNSIEAVLEFLDNAKKELDDLVSSEQIRAKKQARLTEIEKEYDEVAAKLTEKRKAAADKFSKLVMAQLSGLGLKKAGFDVGITKLEGQIASPDGADFVEFMFSANEGEPQKPLRKVASGGEISRIMLSLKSVLCDCEDIGTMIFDEIDTGISGQTATAVGLKMSDISEKKQVIAITHLPQIAAFADSHYIVEKIQANGTTTSSLRLLDESQRAVEVARIMGGIDSALAVDHAVELIKNAQNCKANKQ